MSIQNFQKVLFALMAIVVLKAPGDEALSASGAALTMRSGVSVESPVELGMASVLKIANGEEVPAPEQPSHPLDVSATSVLAPIPRSSALDTKSRDQQLMDMGLKKLELTFAQAQAAQLPLALKASHGCNASDLEGSFNDPYPLLVRKHSPIDLKGSKTVIKGVTSLKLLLSSGDITFTPYGQAFVADNHGNIAIVPAAMTFIHPSLFPKDKTKKSGQATTNPDWVQVSLYYPKTGALAEHLNSVEQIWSKTQNAYAVWTGGRPTFFSSINPWPTTHHSHVLPPSTNQVRKFILDYVPPEGGSLVREIKAGEYNHVTPAGDARIFLNAVKNEIEVQIRIKSEGVLHIDYKYFPDQLYDGLYADVIPFTVNNDDSAIYPRQLTVPLMIALGQELRAGFDGYKGPMFGEIDDTKADKVAAVNKFLAVEKGIDAALLSIKSDADNPYAAFMRFLSIQDDLLSKIAV